MFKKYGDIAVGVFYLCFAVVLFCASFGIQAFVDEILGPEFMPQMMAVIIFVLALLLLFQGIKNCKRPQSNGEEEGTVGPASPIRALLTLIIIIAYIALMDIVGFIPVTIIYLVGQIALLTPKEKYTKPLIVKSLIISIISPIVLYYIFYRVFGVFLPEGIW